MGTTEECAAQLSQMLEPGITAGVNDLFQIEQLSSFGVRDRLPHVIQTAIQNTLRNILPKLIDSAEDQHSQPPPSRIATNASFSARNVLPIPTESRVLHLQVNNNENPTPVFDLENMPLQQYGTNVLTDVQWTDFAPTQPGQRLIDDPSWMIPDFTGQFEFAGAQAEFQQDFLPPDEGDGFFQG